MDWIKGTVIIAIFAAYIGTIATLYILADRKSKRWKGQHDKKPDV